MSYNTIERNATVVSWPINSEPFDSYFEKYFIENLELREGSFVWFSIDTYTKEMARKDNEDEKFYPSEEENANILKWMQDNSFEENFLVLYE